MRKSVPRPDLEGVHTISDYFDGSVGTKEISSVANVVSMSNSKKKGSTSYFIYECLRCSITNGNFIVFFRTTKG